MLQRTFLHLPGIGEHHERRLWRAGLQCWQDAIAAGRQSRLTGWRANQLIRGAEESLFHFESGHWSWFEESLPASEKWRAFGELGRRALYVDIETTGLGHDSPITVLGVYDGRTARAFVAGQNLDEARDVLEAYPLLVTFNGAQFDLPVIRSQFRGLGTNHVHLDLRFPLKRLGWGGGLKKIEQAFGIERSERTRGLDGWDAVRLWDAYQRGRGDALDLLVEYNLEDVKNLEPLAQWVYEQHCGRLKPDMEAATTVP